MTKESLIADITAIAKINGHSPLEALRYLTSQNAEHISCKYCKAILMYFGPKDVYLYNTNYSPCDMSYINHKDWNLEELKGIKDWLKSHGWALERVYNVALGIRKAPERRSKAT